MSKKLVERRLDKFEQRCGDKYGKKALHLASYAALPVALNPELLHFLRINFFSELPYTVEIEFFASGLCREIGAELYEIEPDIRDRLLENLNREDGSSRNGNSKIKEIVTLLWQYVKDHSPWEDRVELERAQQLTALHFLDRAKAQEWLNNAEENRSQGTPGQREWFVAMRQELSELIKRPNPGIQPGIGLELDGKSLKQFHEALLSAFPSEADLYQMVSFELDENLDAISTGGNHYEVVFELIQWAQARGKVEKLLTAARSANPGNPKLKNFDEQMRGKQDTTGEDDLSSERGLDYSGLRDLLKAQNWKAADKETFKVMLQAADRQKKGWLDADSIKNFPCTDLRTIDQLWVKYSNGHFGFSVQKRIWLKCGGKVDYGTEEALVDVLGWRKKNSRLGYKDITFTLNAPEGHLPFGVVGREQRPIFRSEAFDEELYSRDLSDWATFSFENNTLLPSRLVKCNI